MNNVALEIGNLTVHWYGVLVAVGFLAGLWTASRRGLRDGLPADTMMDLGPWLIVGAIVGARLLYVVSYWNEVFAEAPWWEVFMIHHGGLVYYGGLLGAIGSGILFVRRRGLPLWKVADTVAPSIALGHVFGRIGCLMNGCCYGVPTDLPWGIRFPHLHESGGVPVHPTQIYESTLNLALYVSLAWLFRRKRFHGQVFACYLVAYALLRSLVELFRGDYEVRALGVFTPGQLVSIAVFTAGAVLLWRLPRQNGKVAASERSQ